MIEKLESANKEMEQKYKHKLRKVKIELEKAQEIAIAKQVEVDKLRVFQKRSERLSEVTESNKELEVYIDDLKLKIREREEVIRD